MFRSVVYALQTFVFMRLNVHFVAYESAYNASLHGVGNEKYSTTHVLGWNVC